MADESPSPDPAAIMRSRQFIGLLALAAIVGVVAVVDLAGYSAPEIESQSFVSVV